MDHKTGARRLKAEETPGRAGVQGRQFHRRQHLPRRKGSAEGDQAPRQACLRLLGFPWSRRAGPREGEPVSLARGETPQCGGKKP